MSKRMFGILIGLGIFIGVIVVSFAVAFSTQNKAISLEEQINESKSSIEIQEKRRVDLILNLVDTVKSYNKHEKDTLTQLTEARTNASKGNVEQAELTIQAVTEAYPDLKSQQNYKELMNELSTTENLIAEHRNNFNIQVKAYNKHIRKFPNSILLNVMGYEKINITYLEYNAPSDAPKNLFDEGK
jgi:LemA protein